MLQVASAESHHYFKGDIYTAPLVAHSDPKGIIRGGGKGTERTH